MGFGLFFLAVAGGWFFCRFCIWTRFYVVQLTNYEVIIAAAMAGAVLGLFSRVIWLFADAWAPGVSAWLEVMVPTSPGVEVQRQYAATAAGALVLGPALALLINVVFFRTDSARARAAKQAYQHFDKVFELLFEHAMQNSRFVELTLRTRKVYMGWVLNCPPPHITREGVEVAPIWSGFRDEETLEVVFTTQYDEVLRTYFDSDGGDGSPQARAQQLRDEGAVVVFPMSEVVSARIFDEERYRELAERRLREGESPREIAGTERS